MQGGIKNNWLLHSAGGILAAVPPLVAFFVFVRFKFSAPPVIACMALGAGFFAVAITKTFLFDLYMFNPFLQQISYNVGGITLIVASLKYAKIQDEVGNIDWLTPSILATIASAVVASVVLYVSFHEPGENIIRNDFPNWVTLVVEIAFGIIITLIVYNRTQKPEEESKKILFKVRNVLNKIKKIEETEKKEETRGYKNQQVYYSTL